MVMVGTNREREKERERNICNVWALIGKGMTGRVRKEWFLMVLIGKGERKIWLLVGTNREREEGTS